jgi:molybdate transport system substrate-binding protein
MQAAAPARRTPIRTGFSMTIPTLRLLLARPALVAVLMTGWLLPAHGDHSEPLTVAAAASLQPVFKEIGRVFQGGEVTFVFGASGNLAQQMEHGAPYDLLVSAEEAWVRALATKGVIDPASVRPYARGGLAVVLYPPLVFAPERKRLDEQALGLLRAATIRHIALANPAHAPYGIAARQALRSAGLWEALRPRLVFGENVRQTLSFVETGNAEAGLVAESVAHGSRLPWLPVAAELHAPIRQALGIRQATGLRRRAEQFVALLSASAGREILRRYGLVPLPEHGREGRRP